jgi:hypothetical protein
MRRISLLLAVFCFCSFYSEAQNMQVLYGMDRLYQGSYLNPAFIPNNRVVVSIPSFYNNLSINGPAYSDVVKNNGLEDYIDINSLLSNLQSTNYLREDMEIQTIGLCLSAGPLGIQAYHKVKFNAFIAYPEELPSLIWEGNEQYLGQSINIGSEFLLHSHSEFGVGASLKLSGLTVGARAKYLNGIGHLSTSNNELDILTNEEDYSIEFGADYLINSANSLDYNSLNDVNLNFSIGDINWNELFSTNNGLAFDLGAQLEMGNFEFSAAINDIGYVNFDTDVRNYSSQGDFSYDGLDVSNILSGQDVELSGIVDTLSSLLNFEENNEGFRYILPSSQYLMVKYKFATNWDIGLSYFHEGFKPVPVNSVSISAGAGIGNIIRLRGAYTVRNDNFSNLGLGVSAKLAFLELFLLSDNVLVITDPLGAKDFNILAGLNFAISRKKK